MGPGRWGPIAGLPLTSGPVSVFLALHQGSAFAATAAAGTLLGLLSQAAFCLVYGWIGRWAGWPASAALAVSAFLAGTVALSDAVLPAGPAFVVVSAILLAVTRLFPGTPVVRAAAQPPGWELPLRILLATGVVGTLTGAAALLGPRWTGLLSPFPVFALVLGVFAHRTQGAAGAAALLRGVVLGSLSHAAMFAIVAVRLEEHGLAATYLWASLGALGVNALAIAAVRRSVAAADRA